MLRTLIGSLGVDYDQWRALTRVALKIDFRVAAAGQSIYHQDQKTSGTSRFFMRYIIYVFMGAMLSGLVVMNKDVFFTGTIVLSYIMVMTSMLVLVDFGAVVISPDDFAILGYQPVSSRTFFFSRLTNVLVYSTVLSTALGIIPVSMYFFIQGFRPLLGMAAAIAMLMSGTTTAMFLVLVYAAVLKVVHPNRLRRVIGYIQLLLSFLIYGGYALVPRMFNVKSVINLAVEKSPWMFLFPPTWFASYLDLAAGRRGLTEILPSLLSIAVLAILVHRAQGKLALEYSDRLSAAAAVSEGPKRLRSVSTRPALLFRGGEARVVALLVRNQFKCDQKFRLAVLSILPLTVMYLYMGVSSGPLADPFGAGAGEFNNSFLLYLAVLMFPTMLRMSLISSDSHQASWIYYATPADRARLVLGSKNFVFIYFVIPYLVFIGAVFLYFFRNLFHVLLQVTVLALLSHFFLQLAVFFNPALPFSQPVRKGQRAAGYMITIMFGPIAAVALLFALSTWVYPHIPLLLILLAAFGGLTWLIETRLHTRVRHRTASLEYQG